MSDNTNKGHNMKSVRIEPNGNGTYSAYIFSTCVCTGTKGECETAIIANGESL